MANIPLGATEYKRHDIRSAEVALVNCLIENDPTNAVTGKTIMQRPGLRSIGSAPDPLRGIYRSRGVLNEPWLVVGGGGLYVSGADGFFRRTAGNEAIPGTDQVRIVGGQDRVLICASGVVYSFDGTTVTTVNMPNGRLVSDVEYINGYFILVCAADQRFYWIIPGGTDPDPLDFASAETSPDNTVSVRRLIDELWFFSSSTIEVWHLTGDADMPFALVAGRIYSKGAASRDCIALVDNTLFWIGADLIAYRADTSPQRISTHTMEERFALAAADSIRDNGPSTVTTRLSFGTLSAWTCIFRGHTLYIVNCGAHGTFAYDVENTNWAHFKSLGQESWSARLGWQVDGDEILTGGEFEGETRLWYLDPSYSSDQLRGILVANVPMERKVTGGIPLIGAPQKCKNVSVHIGVGLASITGTSANPILAMRYSDDNGQIWSSWIEEHMGLQGQYLKRVIYDQLGIIEEPGRIFEFRSTDDCVFRLSYATMNEAIQTS